MRGPGESSGDGGNGDSVTTGPGSGANSGTDSGADAPAGPVGGGGTTIGKRASRP